MANRKFELTEHERTQLFRAYELCKDGPTRTRYQAVKLYGEGHLEKDIEQITGCSRASLMGWCRAYRENSQLGLVDKRAGGNSAKLTKLQMEDLSQRLHQYTPKELFGSDTHSADGQFWTVEDLHRTILKWYGVEYRSRSSYLRLLMVCKFSYQRPEKVFKSRNQMKVADFEEKLEKKMIDTAQDAPDTVFLAEDEASLYLQATNSCVFAPIGQTPIIRVDTGRTQTHFYGTLDLQTGKEIVLRSEIMNAEVSAHYLQLLLDAAPKPPLLLFWDRAPWHRGKPIDDLLAENPRLQLIYFPAASPDLNPQEHVWKAARKAVSHNHIEPRLAELAQRFEKHLVSTAFKSNFMDRYGYTAICPMFI